MFWDNFYKLCILNNTKPNPVCSALGLSTATATHWKNGKQPTAEIIIKLADYFNVSTDYLLGRTSEPQTTPIIQQELPEQQLISNYRKLDNEDKTRISERIEVLLESNKYDIRKEYKNV